MSILLVGIAAIALLFVIIAVFGVFLVMRGDPESARERTVAVSAGRGTQGSGSATDVVFFLRFNDGADADYARELVQRHAPRPPLGPIQTREVALDLTRIARDATHAYLGPCSWPPVKAFSPVTGGVIVGYRARTRVELDTVADDSQLTEITAVLQRIAGLPDAQLIGGVLQIADDSPDNDAPKLVPVSDGAIPGMRPCPSCRQPIQTFVTRCPHCGSRALS